MPHDRSEDSDALIEPAGTVLKLAAELAPVGAECIPAGQAGGRVLAEAVLADRDSPPASVSAMDGYALRLADARQGALAVAGEIAAGQAPTTLPANAAVRVFTGATIPDGAEAVVRREDVQEEANRIKIKIDPRQIRPGEYIRYQGENLKRSEVVVPAGRPISPALAAGLAAFSAARLTVYRRVRVGVVVTGNELHAAGTVLQPWQIHDSNGPALAAMFGAVPWIDLQTFTHADDDLAAISTAMRSALDACDAVIVSGGVSMGDYDYVPAAVAEAGGRIVFHRLLIRPGKPMLGAVGPRGQAILGLPGNPVSVLVTARRFGALVLRKLAGFTEIREPPTAVRIEHEYESLPGMWLYRPVLLTEPAVEQLATPAPAATVVLLPIKGSGDVVAAARSDGFVEIRPGESQQWLPFWRWSL